jgi:hypothetical protein
MRGGVTGAMIVWGGWAAGSPQNTGGRYVPASRPVDGDRDEGSALRHIWTGSGMIVFGGG